MHLFSAGLTVMAGLAWACHAPSQGAPPPQRTPDPGDAPRPDVVAFVDVDVVPMDSERILDDQTVLIQGDRIAAMGPARAVAVPAGATVIDGRGKYLMPGLADMHVHILSKEDLALYLASGVTTVRNMAGFPMHMEMRAQVEAGTLLGPTIYTAGPAIDGVPTYWPGSLGIDEPSRAEPMVVEQKDARWDFLKLYMNLDRPSYEAVIAAARKHGMKTAGHVPTSIGIGAVLGHPIDSLEHLWAYFLPPSASPALQRGPEIMRVEAQSWLDVSEAEMQALARALRQAGIWSCATLTVRRRGPTVEDMDAAWAGIEPRYVSPPIKRFWLEENVFLKLSREDYEVLRMSYGKMQAMVRALRDAGARILLGTDTPNPFVLPGVSAHEELENLVAAGLTPYEALRAGTRDAAEFMEKSGEFGTVASGMRADLLLLDADPLADVANTREITGIMLRGQWLPAERLQHMLDDMVASFATPSTTAISPE
jgi:imidazolonepropionase-like amidohydrolase